MSERCNIPLDGPSALHSALAEDGLLEEHIKVQHPEAQQVFSALAAPVLTAEEIAHLFHEAYERLAPSFGYSTRPDTQVLNISSPNGRLMIAVAEEVLLPLLAAKDQEIAELRTDLAHLRSPADRDSCAAYIEQHDAMESKLREAEELADACHDMLGTNEHPPELTPMSAFSPAARRVYELARKIKVPAALQDAKEPT